MAINTFNVIIWLLSNRQSWGNLPMAVLSPRFPSRQLKDEGLMNFLKGKQRDPERAGGNRPGRMHQWTACRWGTIPAAEAEPKRTLHSLRTSHGKRAIKFKAHVFSITQRISHGILIKDNGTPLSFWHVPWKFSMHAFKLMLGNQLPGKLAPCASFLSTQAH